MSTFIAQAIIKEANFNLERGQAKYRAYFIKTKIYASETEFIEIPFFKTHDSLSTTLEFLYNMTHYFTKLKQLMYLNRF